MTTTINGPLTINCAASDPFIRIRRYRVENGARVYTTETKIYFNGDFKTIGELSEQLRLV